MSERSGEFRWTELGHLGHVTFFHIRQIGKKNWSPATLLTVFYRIDFLFFLTFFFRILIFFLCRFPASSVNFEGGRIPRVYPPVHAFGPTDLWPPTQKKSRPSALVCSRSRVALLAYRHSRKNRVSFSPQNYHRSHKTHNYCPKQGVCCLRSVWRSVWGLFQYVLYEVLPYKIITSWKPI